MSKKIIAIVGMAGSGKSEVVKYIEKKYHWPKIYFGELVFERMQKDGLEINYENERLTREKMRTENGMGVMAKLSLPNINKLLKSQDNILIESLYSWSEYKIMKEEFKIVFRVIAVYASPQKRFERLKNRPKRPMANYKEFLTRDYTEIENIEKGGPIAIADHTLINKSSLKNLHNQIDKIINSV